MATTKKQVNLYLTNETVERLRKLAFDERISMSALVERLCSAAPAEASTPVPLREQMAAIKGKLADLEVSVAAAKVVDPVQMHLAEFQKALKAGRMDEAAKAMGAAFAASRALEAREERVTKEKPADISFDDLMAELDGSKGGAS